MIKNVLAAAAAAGLAFAPIAANAGTRAGGSDVSLASVADRAPAGISGIDSLGDDTDEIWLVFLFAALAAGIIILIEDKEKDSSPGTGG